MRKTPFMFLRRVVGWIKFSGNDVYTSIQWGCFRKGHPDRQRLWTAIRKQGACPFIAVRLPAALSGAGVDVPGPEIRKHGIFFPKHARQDRMHLAEQKPEFVIHKAKRGNQAALS